jgi:hypothetical protein
MSNCLGGYLIIVSDKKNYCLKLIFLDAIPFLGAEAERSRTTSTDGKE